MTAHQDTVLNPLGSMPILGDLTGKLDQAITQLGLPLWLRALAEMLITAVLTFLLLRLVTIRVLPWAANAFVEPIVALVEGVRVVLLLPDLAVSRSVRRFGRVPPEVVYAYGNVVMTSTDAIQRLVRRALPVLGNTRKARRWMLVALLAVGFLLWNSTTCGSGSGSTCTTPVTEWTTSLHTWWGAKH
jgi:hypothetical protein